MKYFLILFFFTFTLFSCKKNSEVPKTTVTKVSQDSLIRTIHSKWKFEVSISNPAVSQKLSNWEDWRNYLNELTISPNASLTNMSRKTSLLVQRVAVLKNNIPAMYNKQESKARLALLETNIQNLDMLLGLEPLNHKEIITLLANIQKNTNSIINQFGEFETKAKIPKELGEDQLIQPIDTVKRATLNALPKE